MKRNDQQMDLIRAKGSPFNGSDTKIQINENVIVKLFAMEDLYRYIGNTEIFERYDPATGL